MLSSATYQVAHAQSVNIPDRALRAAIETALEKSSGEVITRKDMANLLVLDAFDAGIYNIRGLESAVNLTELHLGRNNISNLSPLKGLIELKVLDLHQNHYISNVSPLKDLSNLTWLSLRGNSILNLSPLERFGKSYLSPCCLQPDSRCDIIKDFNQLNLLGH